MVPQAAVQLVPEQFSPNAHEGVPRQQSPPDAPQVALIVATGVVEEWQFEMTEIPLVPSYVLMHVSAPTSNVVSVIGLSGGLSPTALTWATLTFEPDGPADQYWLPDGRITSLAPNEYQFAPPWS